MKNHTPACRTSEKAQHWQDTSKTRAQRCTQNAMDTNQQDTKIQQHKTNMENHRSLKHTRLQAEIQKTSQKQPFTHSDSKKNRKEIPKVLPSANIGKRVSTFKN
jgi:hypothetical protein